MWIMIVGMIILIIIILVFLLILKVAKLKDLEKNCKTARKEIENDLDEKKKKINLFNDKCTNKKIGKLQEIDDDMTIFDIDEILFDFKWELDKLSKEDFDKQEELAELISSIASTDESIDALKDFYNTKAEQYNLFYGKLWWLYKILGFKEKKLFNIKKYEKNETVKN